MVRNKKAINELAGFIDLHGELKFAMERSSIPNNCGTAGCIGGFAAALWPKIGMGNITFNDIKLGDKLGLSRDEIWELCYIPRNRYGNSTQHRHITRSMAVACLDRVAQGKAIFFDEGDR
jgi:hypothetical protein